MYLTITIAGCISPTVHFILSWFCYSGDDGSYIPAVKHSHERRYNMKKGWLYSLLGIFLCLLTLGGVTINSIYRIQRHGSLINYTGIVRGASQKLIKMELNDIQGDDLILYIDEILDSLTEGSGVYDLPLPDDENYQSKLGKTKEAWEQIKKQIYITRKDSGNMAAKNQLLQDSEQFFNTTNDMVFAAESFTNQHARRLMLLDIIMFACVLALWIFIFITKDRKSVV